MFAKTRWEQHILKFAVKKSSTSASLPLEKDNSTVLVDLDKVKRRLANSWPFFVTPILRLSDFSHIPTTLKLFRDNLKSGIIADLVEGNEEYITKNRLERGRKVKRCGRNESLRLLPPEIVSHLSVPMNLNEFRRLKHPIIVSSQYEIEEMMRQNRYSSPLDFILHVDWACGSSLWDVNLKNLFRELGDVHRLVGIYVSSSAPVRSTESFFESQKRKKNHVLTIKKFERALKKVSTIINIISRSTERSEDFKTVILGHPFSSHLLLPPKKKKKKKKKTEERSRIGELIQQIFHARVLSTRTASFQSPQIAMNRRRIIHGLKVYGEVGPKFLSDCFCLVSKVKKIRPTFYPAKYLKGEDWLDESGVDGIKERSSDGCDEDYYFYHKRRRKKRRYLSYEVSDGICTNVGLLPRKKDMEMTLLRSSSSSCPVPGSVKVEALFLSNKKKKRRERFVADIVGPSKNVDDVLCKQVKLPRLKVGDVLYFPEFGELFCGKVCRRSMVGHKDLEIVNILDGERVDF